ncbi:NAD synthetase [Lysinibacillus parviboronicapiens]|uniref:NAD synthetase n=1 Tax=Lysinibacillus parviboronicapiens TaxID=436516 RepID=A0ABV2PQJ6_9BACI|nr:NAD synthetase [Lysinibacillus parviboronicapiens]
MRTSRVSATTNSTFRNEQQYLHAGDISHNFGQHPKQKFKQSMHKNKDNKQTIGKKQMKQNSLNKLETAPVDSGSNLQIRNELSETAVKLSRLSKQKKRLNSYRTSI